MTLKKHKVLLFGEKIYGPQKLALSIDYCEVEFIAFPSEYNKLPRLANYDLVILDYSAFCGSNGERYFHEQEIFEKQMLDALENKTCFCILHYNEMTPSFDQFGEGCMNETEIDSCKIFQIGFGWLYNFNIRPVPADSVIPLSCVERNEFKAYQEKYGASRNVFKPYKNGKFGDIIFSLKDGYALGFSISVRKGKILYLPCQRDFARISYMEDCLATLINSSLTYIQRSFKEIPAWAKTPIFSNEKHLSSEMSELQKKVKKVEISIEQYQLAKQLVFLSEYDFEEAVSQFFDSHLKIPILRNEQYKEDFWILDSQSKKIVIVETKSYSRGFKKSSIYSLYNHRESYNLDESFPAILIANAHLNAASWKEKIRPIDPQDYNLASKDNILLLRIEDLLFLWNSIDKGIYSKEKLISLILNEKGWAEVDENGKIEIHK